MLFSQDSEWRQMDGPYGGKVNCIYETESGDLFIGSDAGVYFYRFESDMGYSGVRKLVLLR